MHEFSIAMNIVDIAAGYVGKESVSTVKEIEVEVDIAGGLPAVMGLAQRAGFTDLLKDRLTVASPNAVVKTRALVSGMLAGADTIDGMDILRSGGSGKVVGAVRAPSTLGTHLRSYTHGHTLQLGAINRQLLTNLAPLVPTLFGSDPWFVPGLMEAVILGKDRCHECTEKVSR